jgi:hypothetical protein
MMRLTREQIAEYWHRSFKTADGLWFVKVEDRYGFETALDIDDEVWKVVPKIQARMLKSMSGLENGISGLFEAIVTKLDLDGFTFEAARPDDGTSFEVVVTECPWHNIMVGSGREQLSGMVGTRICSSEYSAWAAEFGGLSFELGDQICAGCRTCVLKFSSSPRAPDESGREP